MTLLPHEDWNVVPVRDRATYKVAVNCCVPGCTKFSDHSHHLWRRSHGTNEAWVCLAFLPDKPIIGNLVGLCFDHHNDVTGEIGGHRARIAFDDKARKFFWVEIPNIPTREERWIAPLKFQPPGLGASDETASPAPVIEDSASPEAVLAEDLEEIADELQSLKVMDDSAPDVMREAAKVLRRRAKRAQKKADDGELKPTETRSKKTWTVKVPDDTEDGYAVLDSLVDAASEKLGRGGQKSALVRYFTVVESLVFLLQHELEEAEGA